MFQITPLGMGTSSAGPSIPRVMACPRPSGAVTRPHTPARLKLYPRTGMPASPMWRMMVLTFSICCGRCGPSNRMSCQCAGSRFSIASRTSPASSISPRSVFNSSTDQSLSGSPATPHGSYFAPDGLIVARIRAALVEIIHQVNNHMSASSLPREVVVVARQHVTIKAETNFHRRLPILVDRPELNSRGASTLRAMRTDMPDRMMVIIKKISY